MNATKHHDDQPSLKNPHISYEKNGNLLEIICTDYSGTFTKESFFKYVSKMKHVGTKSLEIDSKEKGAGLGIIKMLHHCHGMIVQVDPKRKTVIRCIIDTSEILKSPAVSPRIIAYTNL